MFNCILLSFWYHSCNIISGCNYANWVIWYVQVSIVWIVDDILVQFLIAKL